MKTPESLVPAVDCGVIQEVIRPLMSGKEAQIYVVLADGDECVAKVYKEASQRTFKHRAQYTEGRRTRNTRDQRAISKRTRHGRAQDESGWRTTEVDMIYRLRDAGVRVPEPINFLDGVLVMELVKDAEGMPAPRLGDLRFEASEALEIYRQLLREVSRMLCAGVIHGDLSDFNVLMGADGPVLIDFPQSMDAASNQGARKFLLRDVENLHRFAERYCPDLRRKPYGEEMWSLYEANRLDPDAELHGNYRPPESAANTEEVLALIDDADRDEYSRREARGEPSPPPSPKPLRTVVDFTNEAKPRPKTRRPAAAAKAPTSAENVEPKNRRGRRRRGRKKSAAGSAGERAEKTPGGEERTRAVSKKRPHSGQRDAVVAKQRPHGEQKDAVVAKKRPIGSEGAERPSRRRSRGRRRTRARSAEPDSDAKARPTRPDNAAKPQAERGTSPAASAGSGTERPARRRRRRPRSADAPRNRRD